MQRFKKQYLSFLILITLVIGAMVPFFAVYNPEATNTTKTLSDVFGGKILICTGDGFKWINLEDLAQEKEHIPSDHYKCPLCYVAAHVPHIVLSGAGVSIATAYMDATSLLYSHYNYIPLPLSIAANTRSRAPPFSFVS